MPTEKIVIIRNAAPYDFGGGERFPVFLATSLAKQGVDSIIVSRSKKLLSFAEENNISTVRGWWCKRQNWSGVRVFAIPIYIVWQIILFFYYVSLIKKVDATAVHIQSKDDFISATYAAKFLGKRVIWTDHADLKHVFQNLTVWYKNPIGKMVYRAAHKADTITVVSESERRLVTAHFPMESAIKSKILVVYNGVVDQSRNYPRKLDDNMIVFLVASRLVSDKGIAEVIDAFRVIGAKYPNTKLIIIGDGPEAARFKKKAATIPNISLLGHQRDPLSYMATASIFVHPTYHEGFSVALVEAGMMSLPIIATSVGGNVEIIQHNKTGLLIEAKNTDALTAAMERLIIDENLRSSIAANARKQYVTNFQFDSIVKLSFIPLYTGVSS